MKGKTCEQHDCSYCIS